MSAEWLYLDDDGVEQGPFAEDDMTQWFSEYFSEETKAKVAGSDAEFVAIGKLQPRPAFAGPPPAVAAPAPAPAPAPPVPDVPSKPAEVTSAQPVPPQPPAPVAEVPKVKGKYTWYYTDVKDVEHGPWSTKQMRHWIIKGFFFGNDCPVRRSDEPKPILFSRRHDKQFAKAILPQPAPAPDPAPAPPPPSSSTSADISSLKEQDSEKETSDTKAAPAQAPETEGKPETEKKAGGSQEPEWIYLDQEDKEQGPWTSAQMREWWNAGFLAPTVRVREVSESLYTALAEKDCCFKKPAPAPPSLVASAPTPAAPGPTYPSMTAQGASQFNHMQGLSRPNHANHGFRPPFQPPFPPFRGPPHSMGGGSVPPWGAPRAPLPPRPPADYAQTAAFGKGNRFKFSAQGAKMSGNARGEDNIAHQVHWKRKGLAPDTDGRQMSHFFDFDQWQEKQQQSKKARHT